MRLRLLWVIVFSFACSEVQAEEFGSSFSYSRSSESPTYGLSVAGAVAAPSSTAYFGENPSGLIYTQRARISGFVSSSKDHPELISEGLSFAAGNGRAAATIGLQTFNNAADSMGSITSFNFGAATYAEFLNLALGMNGSYRFARLGTRAGDPSQDPTWSANLGLLFNPYGNFRIGLNLYELSKGLTGVATGVSMNVNSVSVLSLDAGVNQNGRGLTIKPGIGVRAANLKLTYAYGIQLDRDVTSCLTAGNTIGLGYDFSPSFQLQGYYNHFETFYLGATLGF